MSKRNKIIIESSESKALKRLRLELGLSLRVLATKMNLSFTRVHQMETGREVVNERYISKFLEVTNVSASSWNQELDADDKTYLLRLKCIDRLREIEKDKVELIFNLLSSFS